MPDFKEKIIFVVTLIITDLVVFVLTAHTRHFIKKCVNVKKAQLHIPLTLSAALIWWFLFIQKQREVAEHTQSLKFLFVPQRWLSLGQAELYCTATWKSSREGISFPPLCIQEKRRKQSCRQHVGYHTNRGFLIREAILLEMMGKGTSPSSLASTFFLY